MNHDANQIRRPILDQLQTRAQEEEDRVEQLAAIRRDPDLARAKEALRRHDERLPKGGIDADRERAADQVREIERRVEAEWQRAKAALDEFQAETDALVRSAYEAIPLPSPDQSLRMLRDEVLNRTYVARGLNRFFKRTIVIDPSAIRHANALNDVVEWLES